MGYRLRNALIEEYGHIIDCGHISCYPRIDGNEWEKYTETYTKPDIEKLQNVYRLLVSFYKNGYITTELSLELTNHMFALNYAKYGNDNAKNITLHWIDMYLGTANRTNCRTEVIKQWTKMKMKKLLRRIH